ncbi:succinate dehydrogenase and fumarate reductase iron-sulfur family protein [Mycobacterium ulcerans str. Harvey]|uniref:succinate dehydrogenase n=1 Tax=Mycobacterium ulcerans str. Harvey TaxID=1299332 RepID=A0ABN0R2G1_MYCUL|nr:succinate dehydrogenase and fumarate reductase iron-sulfur family protein [Mycobacterium ulcerans str. Harvey]
MMVTVKIARYNPDDPEAFASTGGWQSFRVPCLPSDRLLNLLIYIKGYLDGTLTFRRSCAHGVCGSDAMRINGVNRLACKVLMRDLLPKKSGKQLTLTVEPIRGLPVEKDLVVDMEPFFDAYRAVKPYLITSGNPPTRERIQSPTDRARYDDTTKCILCACCTTSCPVFWNEGSYLGRRRSSTRTASFSTAVTRRPPSESTSSTRSTACGAAAPRSTAPRPARAASRRPRRSRKSSGRCCSPAEPVRLNIGRCRSHRHRRRHRCHWQRRRIRLAHPE